MTATTIDTPLAQTDPVLPSAREIARKLAVLLAVLAAGALLITSLPGLEAIPGHLAGADPAWIVAALVFEIASTIAFAVTFHGVYERRVSRRASASLGMAMQGMNIVLPAGGTGGLAAGAVIMDRAGVPRGFAASRTVTLFLITSLASFLAVALAGIGVATGLLGGDVPLTASLVPAVIAIAIIAAVANLARSRGSLGAAPDGRARRALWSARVYLRDGVATSIALLRAKDGLVIWGSIGYYAFDVAAMAASFKAIGADLPLGVLVLAYTLGHAGAIIPVPGSSEGGLIGMFVIYGAALAPATAAVLAYRAVHAGVPSVLGIAGLADLRRQLRSGASLGEPVSHPRRRRLTGAYA
jgi:uncharacterized membrane protein YbhN (UPF0104 family)